VPLNSTTLTGATTGGGAGSGSGGGSGGACVADDTEVVALSGEALCHAVPCEHWLELHTTGGHTLRADPRHRIFTEEGCVALKTLQKGARIVTLDGISTLQDVYEVQESGKKIIVWVPRGHLYWSNRILSHNIKPITY
jgi:hypothetical protein